MIIHPHDPDKVVELKKKINKNLEKQRNLADKYKSVSQYRGLQQDIYLMELEIEEIYQEEHEASFE